MTEFAVFWPDDITDGDGVTVQVDASDDEAVARATSMFPDDTIVVELEPDETREAALVRHINEAVAEDDDPDEADSDYVDTTEQRSRFGASHHDRDGKPLFEPGSCYHAILTAIDYANEHGQGPVKGAELRDPYEAFGFAANGATATLSTLRDKYEAVAPVRRGDYPAAYVVTYRGAEILDDYGEMEPDEETLKQVSERRNGEATTNATSD